MKIYKYMVEDELAHLKEKHISEFRNYLDRLSKKNNKIVLFKNKDISCYYCTYCQTWHFLNRKVISNLKKGDYITCEGCKNRFEVIYKNNIIDDYKEYITLFEENSRNEIIIRIFFYEKRYDKRFGVFYDNLIEVERMNIDHEIEMKNHSIKVMGYGGISHNYSIDRWTRDRTGYYEYYPMKNVFNRPCYVKKLISKYPKFKYSCIDLAVKHHIDIFDYLKLYVNYPKVELLMKFGCTKIVEDMCGYVTYYRPYILNRLDKKGINMLRKYNLSYQELEIYQKTLIEDYSILKKGVSVNYLSARLKHNAKKVICYLYEKKYNIVDYEDYIRWCIELGMNLNDKDVLYPSDPHEAHDLIFKEKEKYEENIYNEKIGQYAKELANLQFEKAGLIIRPALSHKELIIESKELEHCVRTYAKRMAKRETSIFFIRKDTDVNNPYVTLELKNNKVVQCRGYKNNTTKPLDEKVKLFVNDWCQKFGFISCFS